MSDKKIKKIVEGVMAGSAEEPADGDIILSQQDDSESVVVTRKGSGRVTTYMSMEQALFNSWREASDKGPYRRVWKHERGVLVLVWEWGMRRPY